MHNAVSDGATPVELEDGLIAHWGRRSAMYHVSFTRCQRAALRSIQTAKSLKFSPSIYRARITLTNRIDLTCPSRKTGSPLLIGGLRVYRKELGGRWKIRASLFVSLG